MTAVVLLTTHETLATVVLVAPSTRPGKNFSAQECLSPAWHGTTIHLAQHDIVLTTDASLQGWGKNCEGASIQVTWWREEKVLLINLLKFRAVLNSITCCRWNLLPFLLDLLGGRLQVDTSKLGVIILVKAKGSYGCKTHDGIVVLSYSRKKWSADLGDRNLISKSRGRSQIQIIVPFNQLDIQFSLMSGSSWGRIVWVGGTYLILLEEENKIEEALTLCQFDLKDCAVTKTKSCNTFINCQQLMEPPGQWCQLVNF